MPEQPVGQQDGLGALHVGVAGHQRAAGRLGLGQQRGLQLAQRRVGAPDRAEHPQPYVGGDLVVAAAAGVQFAG